MRQIPAGRSGTRPASDPALARLRSKGFLRSAVPYTGEDLDEMIAVQEKFFDAVGFESGGVQQKLWVRLWVGVSGVTSDNSLRKNGGDDETRTRDLCREKAEALTMVADSTASGHGVDPTTPTSYLLHSKPGLLFG
jgi:hypothetical protein